MLKNIKQSEKISCYTHCFGLILSFIGTIPFLITPLIPLGKKVSSIIYLFSIAIMFGSSSIYHYLKQSEDSESIWRKFDHIAIFIAIAGTYTPYSYIFLTGYWRWSIIILQWLLVIAGIFFKIFYPKAPRFLSTALYLIMGWIAIFPLKKLIQAMPLTVTLLVFTGGIFYTIGAVIYGKKKPNPIPGTFGFHEIFHICILIAAISHYIGICIAVFNS